MTPTTDAAALRPRVEGVREAEILEAALQVLVDVGYDRLTMDAVAARAKASKATLYRRWNTKVRLVIEALQARKGPTVLPNNGSLREDLRELLCGLGGLVDEESVAVFGSVVTAVARDRDFAEAFRRDVVGPKIAASRQIWERAVTRGEVRPDADLSLLEPALAGIVLHRAFILGEQPSEVLITRVIDQIILPAAAPHAQASTKGTS